MKRYGRYIFISTALMLLYLAVLFFCCLYDFSDTEIQISGYFLGIRSDKWVHFAMFLPYPLVCRFLLYILNPFDGKRYMTSMTILLSGIMLACMTELFQLWFTNYRSMDYTDCIADCVGLVTGTFAAHCLFVLLTDKKNPAASK